ncbi:MAG: hypothetical protein IPK03_09525 [Bacteroidetes bacterium]|nr:hypothetical protein [Bacteroidota bacterium]
MKFVAQHVYFCEDDEGYQIGKNTYFVSGIYHDTIKQVNGCDSILEVNLHVVPIPTPISYSQFFKLCQGDTLILPNNKITTAGTFIDTFKNIAGCDSAYITAIVSIKNKSFTTIDTSFCKGEKIIVGSKTYDSTGNYTIKLTNYLNCDSVITLKLIVHPKYNLTVNQAICSGASFHFKGQNLTNAGVYRDTLISSKGCDSMVTLNLTVLSAYFSLVNQSICQGEIPSFLERHIVLIQDNILIH